MIILSVYFMGAIEGVKDVKEGIEGLVNRDDKAVRKALGNYIEEGVAYVAGTIVPAVRATIGEGLMGRAESAQVAELWDRDELQVEGYNTEPHLVVESIKACLETWLRQLKDTGERDGDSTIIKPVIFRSSMKRGEIVGGAAGYFTRFPLKERSKLAKSHISETGLAILDAVVRNIAHGEVERNFDPSKERKHKGRVSEVREQRRREAETKEWYRSQREAGILVSKLALAYRDVVYPGQDLTDQMLIEAMLIGVLPTSKVDIVRAGDVIKRYFGKNKGVGIGENAQLALERQGGKLITLLGLLVSTGWSAIVGGRDALPLIKWSQGFSEFFTSLPRFFSRFEAAAVRDFLSDWKVHIFTLGGVAISLITAIIAFNEFTEAHNPVNISKDPVWVDVKSKLIGEVDHDTLAVEENRE